MNRALKLNRNVMAGTSLRRCVTTALLAAAISLGGCERNSGDVTRVGVIGAEPKMVETVTAPLSAGDALVRANMAQGLVRIDERGQVVPGLAERWNVSDDGLSYIFRLQTGEWPDGRKIKADDIARILNRQLRSASTNPLKDTLGAVDTIVAMTDRVIEIRLNAPRGSLRAFPSGRSMTPPSRKRAYWCSASSTRICRSRRSRSTGTGISPRTTRPRAP